MHGLRKHILSAACLAGLAAGLATAAGAQTVPEHDVTPSKDQTGVVHVNAVKNPEIRSYRAIVAGLDIFDEQHAMAPAAPRLLFQVRARDRGPLVNGPAPTAKLTADDFVLPLILDDAYLFSVPRSEAAWDAKAELVLSRKRKEARVLPYVRTPGLADNQYRLGDMRLECQAMVAIAKKEAPLWVTLLVNTVILTNDWCSFMTLEHGGWSAMMPAKLASATLRDGERSLALPVEGNHFKVGIGDRQWSHDAIVEVAYAAEEPTQ